MDEITYEWIRTRRRTIAVQIKEGGRVVVRTPCFVSRAQVEKFLEERIGLSRIRRRSKRSMSKSLELQRRCEGRAWRKQRKFCQSA